MRGWDLVSTLLRVLENLSSPNESRRSETEQKIAMGLQQLLEDGTAWRDVTVEKIAEAAGIKRTLFYVYYPDRNAVLIRLGQLFVDNILSGIAKHWLVEDDSAEGIREQMRRFYDKIREYAPVTRAIMEAAPLDDDIGAFWSGLVLSFVKPTQRRIEDIRKLHGLAEGPDAAMTALCLVVMTGRVTLQPVAQDPATSEALFEAIVSIWTDALAKP